MKDKEADNKRQDSRDLETGRHNKVDERINQERADKYGMGRAAKDPDAEKYTHIVIGGKTVKIPIPLVNDVSAMTINQGTPDLATLNQKPIERFINSWRKHYDFLGVDKNGVGIFNPKAPNYKPKAGEFKGADGKWYKKIPTSQVNDPFEKYGGKQL